MAQTNTNNNKLTLLDTINEFVGFMDNSSVPPTSDGMSYTDGSYDVEWNIDNVLNFGGSLSYTINQISAKKSYYDNLSYRLENMSVETHTQEQIDSTEKQIELVRPVITNLSITEALQQRLFHKFVGQYIGIEVGDNTLIQNLVKDVKKHLEAKKRHNMKSKSDKEFDIDLNQTKK